MRPLVLFGFVCCLLAVATAWRLSRVSRSGLGSRRRAGAVVSAASVVAGVLVAAVTPAAGAAVVSPPGGAMLFGAAVGSRNGQTAQQAIAGLEDQLGRTLDLHRTYWRWDDTQPTSVVRDDVTHDRIPLMSILPKKKDGTIVPWADIAAGVQDTTIGAQADALRDLDTRVILIFHHEADISSGYGTPADYVAAFRHYVAVFRAHQAGNVEFATAFVGWTYGTAADAWYPGDDVIDWIGTDIYNFGSCTPQQSGWRSLATAGSAFYAWGSAHSKPLLIAEWGSTENPADPNAKAQWLADATTTLQNWPNVEAVSYFDTSGSCPDWWVDSSASSFAAFSALANSPLAHGKPSAVLSPNAAVTPATTAVGFDTTGSTGAASTTGTGVGSWSLDFGDGSAPFTGAGQPLATVSHLYPAGSWTAALTVTDGYGLSSTATAPVLAAAAPTVSEGSVSWPSATTASVPAWINTNGLTGSYHIEWGTSTGYGSSSPEQGLAAKTTSQAVTYQIGGLIPATRYYWRYVATSAAGTTVGDDRVIDVPGPPQVVWQPVSGIGSTAATLRGTVNPEALPTTYWWQWGKTTAYDHTSASAAVPTGNWAHWFSLSLTGLSAGTTYHARLVAQNSLGTSTTTDQTFRTTG